MTRRTRKQLRTRKGDKWIKLYDELDKYPEASTTSLKIKQAKNVTVYVSPTETTIATGLSTILGFGIGIMTPVTPNALVVTATPIAGNLIARSTPVDSTISWFAIGT